jgi:acetamidase/formamidase
VDGLVVTTGSAPMLEQAVRIAVDGLVGLLEERLGVSRTEAFVLVSAYGDVRIGQACLPGRLDATVYACFPADGRPGGR